MISDSDSSAKSAKDNSSVQDKKNKKKGDRDTKNVRKDTVEDEHDRKKKKDRDKEDRKKGKGKGKAGPMHFTASAEPVAISEGDFEQELPEEVFVEVCVKSF